MPLPLTHTERIKILQSRYIFANYIQQKTVNQYGNPREMNVFFPNKDASIMNFLKVGEQNTTLEEYNLYVNSVTPYFI